MNIDKKNPYKSHKQAMVAATQEDVLARWKFLFIKGDSDFLISSTIRSLRESWIKQGWNVERLEGQNVNPEAFYQATTATSMFEPKLVTFVHDAHLIQDLTGILSSIKSLQDIQNPILFIWRAKDWGTRVQKEVSRLCPLWIPCDEPSPWEVKEFTQDRCKAISLKFNSQALDLFLDATGTSLYRISNELDRLSLVFSPSQKTITREELVCHLDYLKEDHIFKLDQLLCQESFEKAYLLMNDLLNRGESPLGLLAILAMHCRKALQVKSALKKGVNSGEIAKLLRLPPTVVQLYCGYVQKRKVTVFNQALILCQDLDRRLKSQRYDEEIGLSRIIFELSQGHVH